MVQMPTAPARAFLPRWLAAPAISLGLLLSACSGSGDVPGGSTGGTRDSSADALVASGVPAPKVSGPISGGLRGGPWGSALDGLEAYDYVQEEYFFSGTAQGRELNGTAKGNSAEYTTRMIVRRPRTPAGFNGTVLTEWFNVTGEMEFGVLWGMTRGEILRSGYAYVGVSAQKVGVDASPLGIKFWDPVRYAPLKHPGDQYAYDMWSQLGRALVAGDGPAPLGELKPQRILASGESQSAARLAEYVKTVDPEHRVYDGFLIHSWPNQIDNRRVPVLMFLTETEKEGVTGPGGGTAALGNLAALADLIPALGILAIPSAAPPGEDHSHFRAWEVAGSSHYDQQALDYMSAAAASDVTAPLPVPPFSLKLPCLLNPINHLGQERVVRAALHALNEWVISGKAPPSMPRMQQDEDGKLVRDADGLAQGGIRVPPMAVPVGVNEGKTCIFFGSYNAYSNAKIRQLYPSKEDYLGRVRQSAEEAVRGGWLLREGAEAYQAEAEEVGAW